MPMIWNSDAHAKVPFPMLILLPAWHSLMCVQLFVAYMKCHEVKAVNLKGMAEFMGEGMVHNLV